MGESWQRIHMFTDDGIVIECMKITWNPTELPEPKQRQAIPWRIVGNQKASSYIERKELRTCKASSHPVRLKESSGML